MHKIRFAILWLLALSSQLSALFAATREYDAQAPAVPQIDSVDFGGTYADTESYSVTIGQSVLTVTLGDDTTTLAQVASTLKNAINANEIDENKVGSEKRNAAGQRLPEFRDVEAIIDPADSSIVLVRSRVAGVPFGTPGGDLTVSESSASGTITRGAVQAASGPWHWSAAKNWSGDTAPVDDDVARFPNGNQGPKYGLPTNLEVTIQVDMAFVGEIGLRPINTSNGMPYGEYRQQDVQLTNAGTGTAITHLIGLGNGPGSSWININHTSAADLVTSVTVYNTGPGSGATNGRACRLKISNPSSAGTVTVSGGAVEIGKPASGCAFATLNLGVAGDVILHEHAANLAINQSGGNLEIIESTGNGATGTRTITQNGGTCIVQNLITSGAVSISVSGGLVVYDTTKTITALTASGTGVFNAERVRSAFTITDTDLFKGASFLDGNGRTTLTNGIDLNRCTLSDVTIRLGEHKRLTVGAVP